MIRALARASVKNPVAVNLAMLALVLSGVVVYRRMPREVFPDFSLNQVEVFTVFPGAAPEDVERLVTVPIEEAIEGVDGLDDCGVSLHVFATHPDGDRLEHLRFDCFDEDPHYHYVDWKGQSNDMVHMDKIADGDPLAWALDRIRTRLPQMLERAGAGHIPIDAGAVEAILPRVSEAAYRARYDHDDAATLEGALGGGQ